MARGREKISNDEYIKKVMEVHDGFYSYEQTIFNNWGDKIDIFCPVHGLFQQLAKHHLTGSGCQKCAHENLWNTRGRITTEDFIKAAIEIHGNKYNYEKVAYIKNSLKVEIICSIHGSFFQTPNKHLMGRGCKQCGIEYRTSQILLDNEEFKERGNKKHNNIYDYSLVEYTGWSNPVKIICSIHGVFEQAPASHLAARNSGKCPTCAREQHGSGLKGTLEIFIKKAQTKHENIYDYSEVIYVASNKKVAIICKEHGVFWMTPNAHLMGSGCKKCITQVSKGETQWLNSLGIPNDPDHRQVTIKIAKDKWFLVDGLDPENKIIYEFNGDWYHGNPNRYNPNDSNTLMKKTYGELYERTINKQKLLEEVGYKVVSIWESDWKKQKKNQQTKEMV